MGLLDSVGDFSTSRSGEFSIAERTFDLSGTFIFVVGFLNITVKLFDLVDIFEDSGAFQDQDFDDQPKFLIATFYFSRAQLSKISSSGTHFFIKKSSPLPLK